MGTGLSETVNDRLLEVLNRGRDTVTNAIANLGECERNFNDVSGKLEELVIKLNNDNARGGSFHIKRVLEVRVNGYAGIFGFLFINFLLLLFFFNGPTIELENTLRNRGYSVILTFAVFYIIISFIVVELYLVNGIMDSISETSKTCEKLVAIVLNAQSKISEAKEALHEEMLAQVKMQAKITATDDFRNDWRRE